MFEEEQVVVVMEPSPTQEGEPDEAPQQPQQEPDQAHAGDEDRVMLTISPLPFVPLPPYAVSRPSMPSSAPRVPSRAHRPSHSTVRQQHMSQHLS